MLDLGCGCGKICFIASQVVGPAGRVIGVDLNDDMLALARGAVPEVAERVGYGNVEFRKGRNQDLALDLEALGGWLAAHPVTDVGTLTGLEAEQQRLFAEIFRVLRRGGRAVISDIVSAVEVPEHLRADPELWSGCVSGAFQEEAFLAAFERAGFCGIHLAKRTPHPGG